MKSYKFIDRDRFLKICNDYINKPSAYKFRNTLSYCDIVHKYNDSVLDDVNKLIAPYALIDNIHVDNFLRFKYRNANYIIIDMTGNVYKKYNNEHSVAFICNDIEKSRNSMVDYSIRRINTINKQIYTNKQNLDKLKARVSKIKLLSPIRNDLKVLITRASNGHDTYGIEISYQSFHSVTSVSLYTEDICSNDVYKRIKHSLQNNLIEYALNYSGQKRQLPLPLQKIIMYMVKHNMIPRNSYRYCDLKSTLSKYILQEVQAYEMLCELREENA